MVNKEDLEFIKRITADLDEKINVLEDFTDYLREKSDVKFATMLGMYVTLLKQDSKDMKNAVKSVSTMKAKKTAPKRR